MAAAPCKRHGGWARPSSRCTARATNPDSPYRNKNAITPTKGGNTAGKAMNEPRVLRPGNSSHSNRNASGTPIAAASATLATEIQTLAHSTRHSPGRETNAASASGEWRVLWASVWISVASVALAAAIGVPLAFFFEWLEFPGRKTLGSLIALPAVLPPFVGVIAFLFLYGESGFVARAIQRLFGLAQPPWRLQGAAAILLVHAYSMYVYFYLLTRAGLAKLDASMLEAAQALGAGRWETLRRVTLPLLRPSLAGAALLVFMTAVGSFSAPYVFGGGFRVMTTQILATKLNGELPLAMVEPVALALVAVLGFALLRRTEGDDILTALGKGTAPRRRPIRRAGVRTFATTAGWVFAVVLLLPHLTLVLVSLVPYGTWTTETLPPVLSLVNYQRLFSEAERLRPLVNSVWMAAVSTVAAVALALVAGMLVGRRRPWQFRGPIELLLALPWALPGTVFALALLTTFSKHDPLTLRWVLVGTTVLLPLAYLVRNLPVTGRAVLAGYRQLDPALDEAAASLGAGRWATFRRVTLPLLKPALAAGGSLAFVDMIGLMLVLPLLPLYAKDLHADPITIGFLTASFPVAQLMASPVWGRVSDRYGRRPALLVGLTASAIAYAVFGFATSLWLLFVSRFIQGLGGGTTGVAQAHVADTMAPHERAKALGWLSAATSLGVVIGPVLGSFAARAGQAAPGLVAAALCLCNVGFA